MRPTEDFSVAFENYVRKNYYKTGSLMANSCKAAAVLGSHDLEVCHALLLLLLVVVVMVLVLEWEWEWELELDLSCWCCYDSGYCCYWR